MVGRRELDPAVRGRDLRLATGTLDALPLRRPGRGCGRDGGARRRRRRGA